MELTLPYFDMHDDRRRLGTLVLSTASLKLLTLSPLTRALKLPRVYESYGLEL